MINYFEQAETPIIAADFDYFRLPAEKWEVMLTRLRQMGANALNLTVPWGFHELKPNVVDFSGTTSPRRNLVAVLNLCQTLQCPCLLQPGPYTERGLLADGLPLWLESDADFETTLPTAVENWYKALTKFLLEYQWPDGPIIALHVQSQPDEVASPLHNKQLTEVKWRIWLRKRYEGIEALNAAYQSEYRTVNDVKFPETWAEVETPIEQDAAEFLEKVESDTRTRYTQVLVEAGWTIPVYPTARELHPHLPPLQTIVSTRLEDLPQARFVAVAQPIQIDPDPPELGLAPVWAEHAPIRTDASVRSTFWQYRRQLWAQLLTNTSADDNVLTASFAGGGVVSCSHDTTIKVKVESGTKPTAYRLRTNGELLLDESFSVSRARLSGLYRATDDTRQTDLLLYLNEPDKPVPAIPLSYLRNLLITQAHTLTRCAALAQELSESLEPPPPASTPAHSPPPESEDRSFASYTLEEARQGLNAADAALRKAMASISGLEAGFDVMLGRASTETMAPPIVPTPTPITPEIFEGRTRAILTRLREVCTDISPALQGAAQQLEDLIALDKGFTVAQYQTSYAEAVHIARQSRTPLLDVLAYIRLEIASEQLPLLAWRVHNQVQAITESLRWGILRG